MSNSVRRILEVCKDTSSALGVPVVAPVLTAVFSSLTKVLEEAKVSPLVPLIRRDLLILSHSIVAKGQDRGTQARQRPCKMAG
jgi:hypothetical protein